MQNQDERIKIELQLDFVSRHGAPAGNVTQEEFLASLKEEYNQGMFTATHLNFVIDNISRYALFEYIRVHEGRAPGLQ